MWVKDASPFLHRDEQLRARVRQRLEDAESTALRIVSAHQDLLIEMATALLKKRRFEPEYMQPWLARATRDAETAARPPSHA